MLNKDLCVRCRKVKTWWNKHDDIRWERGNVVCVVKGKDGSVTQVVAGVKGEPPQHCLFALEQVVTDTQPKEKKHARANRAARTNA
jgi:hypothetical protein